MDTGANLFYDKSLFYPYSVLNGGTVLLYVAHCFIQIIGLARKAQKLIRFPIQNSNIDEPLITIKYCSRCINPDLN
jgi:hypothetical protein